MLTEIFDRNSIPACTRLCEGYTRTGCRQPFCATVGVWAEGFKS
jgi:hypothetical protein